MAESAATERLEMRLSPEAKEMIVRACRLLGVSVSSYGAYVLYQQAARILQEHQVLTLSERDSRALMDALEQPAAPNEALRQAWEEFGGR